MWRRSLEKICRAINVLRGGTYSNGVRICVFCSRSFIVKLEGLQGMRVHSPNSRSGSRILPLAVGPNSGPYPPYAKATYHIALFGKENKARSLPLREGLGKAYAAFLTDAVRGAVTGTTKLRLTLRLLHIPPSGGCSLAQPISFSKSPGLSTVGRVPLLRRRASPAARAGIAAWSSSIRRGAKLKPGAPQKRLSRHMPRCRRRGALGGVSPAAPETHDSCEPWPNCHGKSWGLMLV
jgi:hypothetical protein